MKLRKEGQRGIYNKELKDNEKSLQGKRKKEKAKWGWSKIKKELKKNKIKSGVRKSQSNLWEGMQDKDREKVILGTDNINNITLIIIIR